MKIYSFLSSDILTLIHAGFKSLRAFSHRRKRIEGAAKEEPEEGTDVSLSHAGSSEDGVEPHFVIFVDLVSRGHPKAKSQAEIKGFRRFRHALSRHSLYFAILFSSSRVCAS